MKQNQFTFSLRGNVTVEPFNIDGRFGRKTKPFRVEALGIYIFADDGEVGSVEAHGAFINKDGEVGLQTSYQSLDFSELPEQAKQAVRDAYNEARGNVSEILREDREA